MTRADTASRTIAAPPHAIYRAFAIPGAMEQWLPPGDMTGKMLHFDFREGGSYRITYTGPQGGRGKSSEDYDELEVRLTAVEPGRRIEQEVTFESEDSAFSGTMRMVWTFQPDGAGTLVTVRATDVPEGISAEDHEAGMEISLANLARFVDNL